MAKTAPAARPAAPADLSPAVKRWWDEVVGVHELVEPHRLRLLHLACQASDRCDQAREAIAEHGSTYVDRFGAPRLRPEVAIERDSRQAFARLVRDLDLRTPSPLWPGL
jgi:phage terminase small subunit